MTIFEFEGKDFTEDIYIVPGDFEVICFEGRRNARLEISAWEIDKEQFDILLVSPSDIMEDRYREDRARLVDYNCYDFEDTYTFDRNHRLCLIISNIRATSRDKLVKLKLSWVIHDEDDWPVKKAKKKRSVPTSQPKRKKTISPKALGYCALLFIPLAVALVVYSVTSDPVIVTAAGLLTSVPVAIFKDEIRDRIGLSH
jgi:hypothetical protein